MKPEASSCSLTKALASIMLTMFTFGLIAALAPLQNAWGTEETPSMQVASYGWTYPDDTPRSTANIDGHNYASDGQVRSRASVMTSYLHVAQNDVLERVEFLEGELFVERISNDYKTVTARKVIDPQTYNPSNLASEDTFAWGGFFSGSSHNYVVTGQQNEEENTNLVVLRVTKYTKNWEYLGNVELRGGNSYHIFSNGSCRMAELNGKLYIRTNHAIFKTPGDDNHEENMTIVVNESSMTFAATWFENDMRYDGRVSHSFNQFVISLNGTIYSLDHGDSSIWRGAVATQYRGDDASGYGSLARLISWESGNSYTTGGMIGGFESSETNGTLIAVGNQYVGSNYSGVMKPWIAVASNPTVLSSGTGYEDRTNMINTNLRYLEPDPTNMNFSAANPYLVKINDDKFLIMWNVEKNSSFIEGKCVTYYQLINGRGEALTELQSARMLLGDCQPLVRTVNGHTKVIWYAGGILRHVGFSDVTDAASPAFYELDVTDTSNIEMKTTGFPIDMVEVQLQADYYFDDSGYEAYDSNGKHIYCTRYDGGAVTPEVSVSFLGDPLTEGVDYTVSYENNDRAGNATIVIKGKGEFANESPITLVILPRGINSATVEVKEQSYTGSPLEPEPIVTDGGKLLTKGVDYTVSYKNNTGPGTGIVTVTGINNYCMEINGYFAILRGQNQQGGSGGNGGSGASGGSSTGGNAGGGNSDSGGTSADPAPAPAAKQSMHRLYNPNSGEHFYTADDAERDGLVAIGWRSEGEGWKAPVTSNTPVYRMYNPVAGEHHYCIDPDERDGLISAGWNYEGVGWYSDDAQTVPLYRDYNPNQFANNHNYTTDVSEHEWLVSLGWRWEGYAWYGV